LRKLFNYDYDIKKGGAVMVQFPQIESAEPRLWGDSYTQNGSDRSFEEKLKYEQARLGLMFSPFSQFESLFSSVQNLSFETGASESESDSFLTEEAARTLQKYFSPSRENKAPSAKDVPLFDSLPLQTFNRQLLQNLLTQSGWLVPNLSAQPLFQQAFLEGKMQMSFDLQSLIDQIVAQAKMVKEKGRTELSLSLIPDELGEVFLTLTAQGGMVAINIQAGAEAKKLLESELETLKKALKKSRISFGEIKIEEVANRA
jgi:flagellar hook-length control protein FliK